MSTSENRPTDPAADQLSDHCYDGIQEYDNPTPRWWDLLFLGTVIFAPIYAIWFHAPQMGRTHVARLEAAQADNMRLQFGEIGELTGDEATILKYMHDPKWLKVGEATFVTHCASCHGREGEGISGPNMTDDSYIHVKRLSDLAKVISEGAKAGAMPAWGNRLHPNEVVLAACYVASLRGQNLPSARKEEGNVIPPWPTAPVAVTVADEAPETQETKTKTKTEGL